LRISGAQLTKFRHEALSMKNYCVSTLSHIRISILILTLSRALLVGLSIDPFLKKLGVESPEKKKAAAGPSQERR
jgi:hypothetical protein